MYCLKNKYTWYEVLGECSSRIKYSSNKIQRAVVWMAFHTHRNRNGNLYVRYLYWNDDQWNWGNNWLDNDWNSDNPAVLRATLFISTPRYVRGVVF